MAIKTVKELQEHLNWAMRVELSTIPLYLYAMYSIDDAESDAFQLIRDVVLEEMLHLGLASNCLIAVGGKVNLYDKTSIPTYPGPVPHHKKGFIVNLEPCTPRLIKDTFMAIEQPGDIDAKPEDDEFHTIGQFYLSIEEGLKSLNKSTDLFANNNIDKQLPQMGYKPPDQDDAGEIVTVTDLQSALDSLEIIVHQGEGILDSHYDDPSKKELCHYFKFEKIANGEVPIGKVLPVMKNPRSSDFTGGLRDLNDFFNAAYCYLLIGLDDIYDTTDPMRKKELIMNCFYPLMNKILNYTAWFIMQQPMYEGASVNAGPSFEYYGFRPHKSIKEQLLALYQTAMASNPKLKQTFDEHMLDALNALPDVTEIHIDKHK